MSYRSACLRVAVAVLRMAVEASPREADPVRGLEDGARRLLAEAEAEEKPITPEQAAHMLGLHPNRVRDLCLINGVGFRISPGRWGIHPDWIAQEMTRRNR